MRIKERIDWATGKGRPLEAWIVLVVLVTLAARPSAGASPAFDSASDPAYNAGWILGSNGGHGWGGPWQATGNELPGSPLGFMGSSTTNGTGDLDNDGDINTPRDASGRAWGLTATAASDQSLPNSSGAHRLLDAPLTVGQTFSVDIDNGFIANPVLSNGMHLAGSVAWGLGAAPAPSTFEFEAIGGQSNYFFISPSGRIDTGIPLTYEGVRCEFTLLGPSAISPFPLQWMLTVTPLSPGSQTYTFTGTRHDEPIEGFGVGDAGAGLDPANAVYFNNISITDVPEPAGVGLVVGSAALLLRQRRRAEWS